MKKTWEVPVICVQQFEANEYVAACWKVVCDINAANTAELTRGNAWTDIQGKLQGQFHAKNDDHTGCGWEDNQVVVTNGNNEAIGMYETNTNGLNTDLTCVLTSGLYSDITSGQTIEWTTSIDTRTWYHIGTVQNVDSAHPNRS